MSTAPIIDPVAIEALKSINPEDGGEFLREIIQIFLEDTPARIAELDEALGSGDVAKFVRAAHSIKGSSSNVGAMLLQATAERLEHSAKDQGIQPMVPLIQRLKDEYALTADKLKEIN